jgi:hypothetical protein
MLISFIIFVLSGIAIGVLIILRTHMQHVREYRFVYPVVKFARKVNSRLHVLFSKIREWIKYVNRKTILLLVYFILDEIEQGFRKLFKFIKKKLPPVKK